MQKPHTKDGRRIFNIVLIGPSGSGKSAFLLRLSGKPYVFSVGSNFYHHTAVINQEEIGLRFWDTSGNARFHPITSSYLNFANGVLYFMDLNSHKQLHKMDTFYQMVQEKCSGNVPALLVGCRCYESKEREISTEEAERLANELGMPYIEVNTIDGTNMQDVKELIASMIIKQREEIKPSFVNIPTAEIFKEALKKGEESLYELRLLVVGHQGVGKTTLTNGLLKEDTSHKKIDSTNGIDIYVGRADIDLKTKEWIFGNKQREKSFDVYRKIANLLERVSSEDTKEQVEDGAKQEQVAKEAKETKKIESGWSVVEVIRKVFGTVSTNPEIKQSTPDSWKLKTDEYTEIEKCITRAMQYIAEQHPKNVAPVQIWDFGGQVVFYSTHQTFLSSRCIYLLVFDISKGLHEQVNDLDIFLIERQKNEVIEFISFWINSIITYSSSKFPGFPKVFLVGTHVDQLPEENRKEYIGRILEEIRQAFAGHAAYDHLVIDPAFCLEATDPGNVGFDILRRQLLDVAETQPHWGEKRPTSWLSLEETLCKMRSVTPIFSFSEVEMLNQSNPVHVMSDQELEAFLEFQHSLGNLLFFPERNLRKYVIIDPCWLIDGLRSLVTAERFSHDSEIKQEVWQKLAKTGFISYDDIRQLWEAVEYEKFKQNMDHLVRVFERLDLLVKPKLYNENGKEELSGNYLLPAMIHTPGPSDEELTSVSYSQSTCMVVRFAGMFLPQAVFNRFIATFLQMWPLIKTGKGNMLYVGFCGLRLDYFHRLYIRHCKNQIVVHVGHTRSRVGISSVLCRNIRIFTVTTLNRIMQCYETLGEYSSIFQIQVPCCPKHLDCIIDCKNTPLSSTCSHQENLDFPIKNWILEGSWSQEEASCCSSDCTGLNEALMSRCPTDQDLGRLCRYIISPPEILGAALDLPVEIIDEIRNNPTYGKHEQNFHLLYHWRNRGHNTSFKELSEALDLTQDRHVHIFCRIYKTVHSVQTDFLKDQLFDCPSDEVLNALADRITPSQAFHLGIELGLPPVKIEEIRFNYPNDSLKQKRKFLMIWKECSEVKPTFGTLVNALDAVRIYSSLLGEIISASPQEDDV